MIPNPVFNSEIDSNSNYASQGIQISQNESLKKGERLNIAGDMQIWSRHFIWNTMKRVNAIGTPWII